MAKLDIGGAVSKYVKLTRANGQTHGGMQWGENVTHRAVGEGSRFCSRDLIHFYDDARLALLHNPVHANYHNPRLWKINALEPTYSDGGMKFGAKQVTTLCEIPLPQITSEIRVRYAILCIKAVYKEPDWNYWADNWLSGKARDVKSPPICIGSYNEGSYSSWIARAVDYAAYATASYAAAGKTSGHAASTAFAAVASTAASAAASVAQAASRAIHASRAQGTGRLNLIEIARQAFGE